MISILAYSVVAILFNRILMNLGGSDGVASLSIIWDAQGLFGSLFRGYVNGISSVVSYNLGRGDKQRLSRLFRISVWILLASSAAVTVISYLLGGTVVDFFAKVNEHVAAISLHGFRIVATSFVMMAVNVFASGWFTALNDGKTSAILSFCRTILFMVIPVLVLPQFFEIDGVWLSISAGGRGFRALTVPVRSASLMCIEKMIDGMSDACYLEHYCFRHQLHSCSRAARFLRIATCHTSSNFYFRTCHMTSTSNLKPA